MCPLVSVRSHQAISSSMSYRRPTVSGTTQSAYYVRPCSSKSNFDASTSSSPNLEGLEQHFVDGFLFLGQHLGFSAIPWSLLLDDMEPPDNGEASVDFGRRGTCRSSFELSKHSLTFGGMANLSTLLLFVKRAALSVQRMDRHGQRIPQPPLLRIVFHDWDVT